MNPLADPFGNVDRKEGAPSSKKEKTAHQKSVEHVGHETLGQSKAEFNDALEKKIGDHFSPISSWADSPFSDTDLIVVKDSYKGAMPRNGIKESELKNIDQIYHDIVNDQTKIRVKSTDIAFTQQILLCIKTLMTREIGRRMIQTILSHDSELIIKPGLRCNAVNEDEKINIIHINLQQKILFSVEEASGKLSQQYRPLFLVLAHELDHIIHILSGTAKKGNPTFGEEYSNLEEQITITGLAKHLSVTNLTEDSWDPLPPTGYDEFNERDVTAAFTGTLTEFFNNQEEIRFPRVGHRDYTPSEQRLTNEEIDLMHKFDSLQRKNPITKEALHSHFTVNELALAAIHQGRGDILEILLSVDPSVDSKEKYSFLLLEAAKYAKKLNFSQLNQMMDSFLKANLDVNISDKEGNTILHYFAALQLTSLVKKLVAHGANFCSNNKGDDPIDFAFDQMLVSTLSPYWISRYPEKKAEITEELTALYQFMKEFYSGEALLEKLEGSLLLKYLICGGGEKTALDCVTFLAENGYDFTSARILEEIAMARIPAVIYTLQSFGLDFSTRNKTGETPASSLVKFTCKIIDRFEIDHVSLFLSGEKVIQELLKATYETIAAMGLSPDIIDDLFLKHTLHYGEEGLVLEVLDFLHDQDYDFTHMDSQGIPVFYYAMLSCKPAVVDQLKAWNCDFTSSVKGGLTPITYLTRLRKEEMDSLKNLPHEINDPEISLLRETELRERTKDFLEKIR